MARSKASFLPR
jgi:hypothetical protein